MISQNATNRLPSAVLPYRLIKSIVLSIVLLIAAYLLFRQGTISFTSSSGGGAATAHQISSMIPALALTVLAVCGPVFSILWYLTYSFMVSDQSITITSGVLVRQSKTIDFVRVQNIDNIRGPLEMLFGLTTVNIWTSSPDQFHTTTTFSHGVANTRTTVTPEGMLILSKQDAEDFKAWASNKGAVQKVQIVPGETALPVAAQNQ